MIAISEPYFSSSPLGTRSDGSKTTKTKTKKTRKQMKILVVENMFN